MDKCKRCKKEKPKDTFTNCEDCRKEKNEQAKRYYEKWRRGARSSEKEKFLLRNKNARLKRKYGISLDQFNDMMIEQKGLCGICGEQFKDNNTKGWGGKGEACVDHDHKTGEVRGVLCRGCNLALSMIEDENFILKSRQYLKKFRDVEDKELLR